MDWVLIGVVSGSLIVSAHTSREACEGRAVILRESKITSKCVEAPKPSFTGSIQIYPNNIYPNSSQ